MELSQLIMDFEKNKIGLQLILYVLDKEKTQECNYLKKSLRLILKTNI
jgi:hypothetical protein